MSKSQSVGNKYFISEPSLEQEKNQEMEAEQVIEEKRTEKC